MLWFPSDSINKQVNNTKSKNKYHVSVLSQQQQKRNTIPVHATYYGRTLKTLCYVKCQTQKDKCCDSFHVKYLE